MVPFLLWLHIGSQNSLYSGLQWANVERNFLMQMVRIVLFIYLFYHILTNYDQVFGGSNEFSIRIRPLIYLSGDTFC
jgi:hypothetical protein